MKREIQIIFGECVKDYRTKMGLSQEKFALKINIDRTYLASVEAGQRNISIINIKKIIDGLGVSMSEFFYSMEKNKGVVTEW